MADDLLTRWPVRRSLRLSRRGLGAAATALAALGLSTDTEAKKKKRKKRKKPCKGGTTRCGKGCVNTKTSAAHCGGCNTGCAANEVCLTGACSLYRFVTAWGSAGDGDDQFSAPHAIALSDGSVYVVDTGNHRVQKFDSDGAFITKWGKAGNEPGAGDGEFAFPEGIDVALNGHVHVGDFNNRRVQSFDGNGVFQATWDAEVNNTPFGPEAIAIDNASDVFVVDRLGHRVVKFDSGGAVLTTLENLGGPGQFDGPEDVAVDEDGNVLVADTPNHRILKFAPAQDPDTYDIAGMIGGPNSGSGDGEFNTPTAIDVDSDGNVYVADLLNHRIQKFAPNAQDADQYDFVTAWGTSGSGDGQFNQPIDLAVAADGTVFVVDFANFRIQAFAPVA